jgi:hypothetical protein
LKIKRNSGVNDTLFVFHHHFYIVIEKVYRSASLKFLWEKWAVERVEEQGWQTFSKQIRNELWNLRFCRRCFLIHRFLFILRRVLFFQDWKAYEKVSIVSIYCSAYHSRSRKALNTLIKGNWAKEIRGRWKRPDVGHHHYHSSSK